MPEETGIEEWRRTGRYRTTKSGRLRGTKVRELLVALLGWLALIGWVALVVHDHQVKALKASASVAGPCR